MATFTFSPNSLLPTVTRASGRRQQLIGTASCSHHDKAAQLRGSRQTQVQHTHATARPVVNSRKTTGVLASVPSSAVPVLWTAVLSPPSTSADQEELISFILSGALIASCGLSELSVRQRISEWDALGRRLAQQMGMDHNKLGSVERLRIYQYYLPVFFWAEQQLTAHRAAEARRGDKPTALVLGISAPQGCGKSTLVEQLEALFNSLGRRAAGVSIDDFYLTFQDQSALAEAHPGNNLLQYRGNAGTHELALGTQTLAALRELGAGGTGRVPRYDKSQQGGRGDRAPASTWPAVEGPLDVLLFEGWMTGFSPITEEGAAAIDPSLVEVNRRLQEYHQAWDAYVDSWLVVRIGDPEWVFKWRLQAEVAMKAKGKPGMSETQVADFVSRFLPAYRAYLPGLYAKGPTSARWGRTLVIEVDEARSPVHPQPPPPRFMS